MSYRIEKQKKNGLSGASDKVNSIHKSPPNINNYDLCVQLRIAHNFLPREMMITKADRKYLNNFINRMGNKIYNIKLKLKTCQTLNAPFFVNFIFSIILYSLVNDYSKFRKSWSKVLALNESFRIKLQRKTFNAVRYHGLIALIPNFDIKLGLIIMNLSKNSIGTYKIYHCYVTKM